jgi:UDPglucose 6-dehydrogenase
MRITMIGSGYVGLVSGACFAQFGHDVVCVDKAPDKIGRLCRGIIPIYEPGLDQLVADNARAGRLAFDTNLRKAVSRAEVVFICVGTPMTRGGQADLRHVHAAAAEIATAIQRYTVIVTKSTVPVGTGRTVARIIQETAPDAQFDMASNPEFLREGAAIADFMKPDRIVIGVESERARDVMAAVYRPLDLINTPMVFTNMESAEVTKYAGNAFLATKITFINEIADLCEKVGADVHDVARGIGLDGRIGPKFLHPGPGFGGSCLPKDTLALAFTARAAAAPQTLVERVIEVNNGRKERMAKKIIDFCGGSVSALTVGVLGLTFKPNTDDMRDAPSLNIVPALSAAGANIVAYDPAGMGGAAAMLPGVTFADSPYEAATGADVLVVLTEWPEFRGLDPRQLKGLMRLPRIIDLRNCLDADGLRRLGFIYEGVGRPVARQEADLVRPRPSIRVPSSPISGSLSHDQVSNTLQGVDR